MQIVVNISENQYKVLQMMSDVGLGYYHLAILNGTPLSKGHGDLVDRDKINSRFYAIWKELESYSNKPSYKKLLDKWSMCIDTAPTLIPANQDSEE